LALQKKATDIYPITYDNYLNILRYGVSMLWIKPGWHLVQS